MARFETVTGTRPYQGRNEDRAFVWSSDDRTVVVVADGAGGIGSGDIAAETVVREVRTGLGTIHSPDEWAAFLKQVDCRIGAGECTAVVADLRPYGLGGASVGDSQAWLVQDGELVHLTGRQNRKPLLDSGIAQPVAWSHPRLDGMLLVATDGFASYIRPADLPSLMRQGDFYALPRLCIDAVRLPSGDLWDDTTVVVTRLKPQPTTRKRYTI